MRPPHTLRAMVPQSEGPPLLPQCPLSLSLCPSPLALTPRRATAATCLHTTERRVDEARTVQASLSPNAYTDDHALSPQGTPTRRLAAPLAARAALIF
eukprot:3450749-Prymnesium_polylepis.1